VKEAGSLFAWEALRPPCRAAAAAQTRCSGCAVHARGVRRYSCCCWQGAAPCAILARQRVANPGGRRGKAKRTRDGRTGSQRAVPLAFCVRRRRTVDKDRVIDAERHSVSAFGSQRLAGFSSANGAVTARSRFWADRRRMFWGAFYWAAFYRFAWRARNVRLHTVELRLNTFPQPCFLAILLL